MKRPKVIFCDIDGTLLLNGAKELPEELFSEIERLYGLGIRFCPASGRQLHSLRGLFAPVADKLDYMCENGNIIFGAGKDAPVLHKTVIAREQAEELSGAVLSDPRCEIMVSGAEVSYLLPKQADFPGYIEHFVGNRTAVVPSVEAIPEDIIKVSAYAVGDPNPLQALVRDYMPQWEKSLRVAVAGERWLDFTPGDKGDGVRSYCKENGIALEDAMAFGDNWNDAAMLEAVGMPYLMENADPALCERFQSRCGNVLEVLRTIV